MRKKTALSLLVSAMLLMTGNAYADDPYTYTYTYTTDDSETSYTIYYTVDDTNATITNSAASGTSSYDNANGTATSYGSDSITTIEIPETLTVDGTTYTVTAIDGSCFANCSTLTSITLPNTVTSIGSYAFYCCSDLTSINFPTSLTSIGTQAFRSCSSLKSVNLSTATELTSIGSYAFYLCSNLTSITLTGLTKLTSIGNYAFYNRKKCTMDLSDLTALKTIGTQAFYCCTYLTADFSKLTNLTSIGNYAFYNCSKLTSANLSGATGLTSLGSYAFYNCSKLTSVKLSGLSNLTSIGADAFYTCTNLESVDLSGLTSLASIGTKAFYGCTSLTSVDLSDCTDLTTIYTYAFYNCTSLTSVSIPSSIGTIGNYAFCGCTKLAKVKIYASKLTRYTDTYVFAASSSSTDIISGLKIYVPPFSLETYQDGWSDTYKSNIYPFVDRAVSSAGVATLALPFTATIPDGVTAYTLSITSGKSATATAVSETTLTKDTPVYIEGSEATYEFLGTSSSETVTSQYVTDDDGDETTEAYNPTAYALVGVYADSYQYAPVGSYVLQNQNGTTAFYRVYEENKVKVGQFKAYLVRESESDDDETESSALSIIFADESETTGIDRVDTTTDSPATGAIYNLQGVRMGDSTECLPKGIYIREGKKFVVK